MMMAWNVPARCLRALRSAHCNQAWVRSMSKCDVPERKGLILGVWESSGEDKIKLSPGAATFNEETSGKLLERFKGMRLKKGEVEMVHDLGGFYAVVMCGLGPEGRGYNETEQLHECKENVRWATAKSIKLLQDQECTTVCVDPMTSADAAAEGTKLASWSYQDFKNNPKILTPDISLFSQNETDKDAWTRGSILADAQNTARYLADQPANIMTPRHFAEEAIRILCPCGVHVQVRPVRWIEDQKMFAFLNMAKGSCEPPYFVEIQYCGGQEADRPVVMCGKGVTFDSGGLCVKLCRPQTGTPMGDMAEKKGAMTGAAVVVGAVKALARLSIPINVIGLIPLFENMPSGSAIKPGDVVMTQDGRTIVVDDTDNEGRLALADTLIYSDYFKPCLDVTIANLTYGARHSLGSGASATYSTSDVVWKEIERAGALTGDRVWRMPLWENYKRRNKMCIHVDVCNVGKGAPDAGCCLGAAFLSEFVPGCDFLHLDTTGTGLNTTGVYAPYLRSGFMTGRPTRTVVQFLNNMACPLDSHTKCSGV